MCVKGLKINKLKKCHIAREMTVKWQCLDSTLFSCIIKFNCIILKTLLYCNIIVILEKHIL